ncbi:MAG: Phosphoribosylanthranilate isomerase (EC [uncultured Campylobacterales bacterium]|uniref:N-(5'-phosphoribosyl)anthranilate isomerase n=1 Tax=uncultured Campylobacterales bacterium TaxID=352960 RepID=A0A6S6SJ48_9BACT|nr:MAG: Phosphoribosylanthranilate isomerase (EC [uncultured Campylobacterales bacterium]
MRVKICGITNLEDALTCVKYGADAIGFVFYEKSARYIEPEKVKKIILELPPFIQSVGLFVNHTSDEVNSIMKECNLDIAQMHNTQDDEFYKKLECKYLKVARIKDENSFLNTNEYYIIDAFVEQYGGEGKRIDTSLFKSLDTSKMILAGGINTSNVQEVLNLGFYALDVSSGVEHTKGKKDHQKIKEFLSLVKNK